MTTAAVVIDRTLRQLLSGTVEARNLLTSTLTSADTSVVVTYPLEGLRAGQVLEIDSELMYIWATDAPTKTLTVQRGFNGTTAAAHTAGAIITVSPRFPRAQVSGINQRRTSRPVITDARTVPSQNVEPRLQRFRPDDKPHIGHKHHRPANSFGQIPDRRLSCSP
jgi:hypothetical protein